jgi:hypothetical protein
MGLVRVGKLVGFSKRTIRQHGTLCIPEQYAELKKLWKRGKKTPAMRDIVHYTERAAREAKLLFCLCSDGHSVENVRQGIPISASEQAALRHLGIDPSNTTRFRNAVLAEFDALCILHGGPQKSCTLCE